MKTETISRSDARKLALGAQGLLAPKPFGDGSEGALRAIEHLGYVQIDTISVVERAHHHVIWSRVPDYRPPVLHELQTGDRQVFEYWSHAAAYLPLRDYRFALPRMQAIASGQRHWFRKNNKLMSEVIERIREEGPLQAKDFEAPPGPQRRVWFDWKPAKRALEQLFMEGKLMIRERRGFQKVYDLPERVLPAGVDLSVPERGEMARYLIGNALRSHGIATAAEMRYLRKGWNRDIQRALEELREEGKILPVQVEGVRKETYFAEPERLAAIPAVSEKKVHILSPFDNFVIQRKRLKALFDFDYQIECYVPEAKRKFGYFCLPVLWGDEMIGRLDAKADRARRVLAVQSLHLEKKSKRTADFEPAFRKTLDEFAAFNGCEKITGLKLPKKTTRL